MYRLVLSKYIAMCNSHARVYRLDVDGTGAKDLEACGKELGDSLMHLTEDMRPYMYTLFVPFDILFGNPV